MVEPILVAENLRKSYGDVDAVNGISFAIARGEVFGLLGPNGAGKTTTISMLTGLLAPSAGRIVVDGIDLSQDPKAVKSRLGLVPQELALYPTLSARDNLVFFGRIYGLAGKRLAERVNEVLEMVGLSEWAKAAVQTYSGGMKRRLNIAAGLLHEPKLLFLDEPTVGVDPQSRNAIFESLENLNRAGVAIVYTTHYMEEAQRLCHRVGVVDHGQLIALDTPVGLISRLGQGLIRVGFDNGHLAAVAEEMRRLPTVKGVGRTDGMLHIQAEHPQVALVSLLEIAGRLHAKVTSLEIMEPNLETVFLDLTGRRLRD